MSDTTGAYEVTLFSETLEKSREFLETGAKVVVTVEATMESDQLKLLGRGVGPVDMAVAVLEEAKSAARAAARGPVQLCLLDPGLPGEVELDLGQDFAINPEVKGALKSLDGVMTVEEL